MKINVVDYKSKYCVYQDKYIPLDSMDFVDEVIDSESITDEQFKEHYLTCRYYGIPAYIGKDERLNMLDKKYELEYNENEQPQDE